MHAAMHGCSALTAAPRSNGVAPLVRFIMASWQSRSKRQGSRVQGEPHRRLSFSLTQVPGGGSLPKERGSGENATHEGGWVCVCVLHGYYPQARNPDSSRNSCWIWNSLSSTDGSTMPPHPRADGPHHSSAEASSPRKPSVPESISSGGFEPATSRCVAWSSSLFN